MKFLQRLFGGAGQSNEITYEPAEFDNFSFSTEMKNDRKFPSTIRGTLVLKDMQGVEIFDGTTVQSSEMEWGVTFIKIPLPEGSDHAELLHHAIEEIDGYAFFCSPVLTDKPVDAANILSADVIKTLVEQGEPVTLNVSNVTSILLAELGSDHKLNAFLGEPDHGVEPQFQTQDSKLG